MYKFLLLLPYILFDFVTLFEVAREHPAAFPKRPRRCTHQIPAYSRPFASFCCRLFICRYPTFLRLLLLLWPFSPPWYSFSDVPWRFFCPSHSPLFNDRFKNRNKTRKKKTRRKTKKKGRWNIIIRFIILPSVFMHVASSLNIPGKGFDFSLVSIELIIFFSWRYRRGWFLKNPQGCWGRGCVRIPNCRVAWEESLGLVAASIQLWLDSTMSREFLTGFW